MRKGAGVNSGIVAVTRFMSSGSRSPETGGTGSGKSSNKVFLMHKGNC